MAAAAAASTTLCCSTKLVYLPSPVPILNPPKSRCMMKVKTKMAASNNKPKNCLFVEARFGTFKTGGAGVLEKPGFDQSQFDPSTQVLEGKIIFCFVSFMLCYVIYLLLFHSNKIAFTLCCFCDCRRRYWEDEREETHWQWR